MSCTILLRGPSKHTIEQIKDAVRDGLRAVKNTIDDNCVIPGAGAFEIAANISLTEFAKSVKGKCKLGVLVFAESILIIPKVLAENSGFDIQETIIKLQDEHLKQNQLIGLDINSGQCMLPEQEGIYDNYSVKKQFLQLATILATQLLLVDEVIRAGRPMGKQLDQGEEDMPEG